MWFNKRDNDIEMSGMIEQTQNKKKDVGPPEETEYQKFNWKRFFLTPKYIPWHIFFIVAAVLTVIIAIKNDAVVDALRPWSVKVRDMPAGWLIPVAILIVISFPPLFGHEIIALLCGFVYGLWIGFAIVSAGTFIGEICTWYAFKYLFRRKAIKLERTNLNYGALARLTRDGGFLIVLIIRLSAIPSHFSTAVFSTCDVKFWHFAVATFCSLPKQLVLVYLGVLIVQEGDHNLVKTVMFGIILLITIIMAVWIYWRMRTVKKVLMEEQEARRAQKANPVTSVPSVEAAFERRFEEEEAIEYTRMQPTQFSSPKERRHDDGADEWTMQPTQPARMF
ncbi:hypothetical protein BDW02DRAFT_503383 [Decorospora gaudefroyi]|uniref:Golgi apparatus membrane protein TVP38 n=1 Tax=Decorospora gaudefroyi TaxID=184978 RepID=A0A6A5K7J0_9PLEO|nr:hypothetical protein BDW02DRAFT_503383 [Decorospora gaudefroyi]